MDKKLQIPVKLNQAQGCFTSQI